MHIVHAHEDTIESLSGEVKVIRLEVESVLREAIYVSEVVVRVYDVESINNARIGVRRRRRVLCKVIGIDKIKGCRSLERHDDELRSIVRDTVVAASGESGTRTLIVKSAPTRLHWRPS